MNQENPKNVFIHPSHEYEYVGNHHGNDRCFCGKPIKNIFLVQHPVSGHTVVLGSECINNYTAFSHIKQAIAEEKKAQKELDKVAKEEMAKHEYLRLFKELSDFKHRARMKSLDGDGTDWSIYWAATLKIKFTGKYVNRLKKIKFIWDQINTMKGSS
jgi:hypothetical protein